MKSLNQMRRGLTWFAVIAVVVGSIGFGLRPSAEAAPAAQKSNPDRHGNRNPLADIPVTGTIVTGGTFRGTMDIVSFEVVNDQLVANGLLDGTLRDAGGRVIGTVTDELVTGFSVTLGHGAAGDSVQGSTQGLAAAPVQTETVTPVITGTVTPTRTPGVVSCRILTLDLGPLDLNLLGLRVQLNDIHLRITAEPGPGNLLGNLLCAVAHLLDSNPILPLLVQIRDILNRIIDLLGTV